jgi:hypothetical protein
MYSAIVIAATTRMRALGLPGTPHSKSGLESIVYTPLRSVQSKGAREERATPAIQPHKIKLSQESQLFRKSPDYREMAYT